MRRSGGLRDESGQAFAWVAVFLPALLVVLGLVVDGGRAFVSRRDLQNLADGAAAAAAMQIDTTTYATSNVVQLDPSRAQAAAEEYLGAHPAVSATVTVEATSVEVTVRERWPTVFLKLFGIQSVTMTARATAQADIGH